MNRQPGRISFVIPTRDNARTIGRCVASAARQGGDIEVIVVDNRSTDGTPDLAAAAGATLVFTAGPERSAQRNRGYERSTGEVVVFIDSDMLLEPGVADDLRARFADADVVGAVLPELAFGQGYLAASRALEKRIALGDPAVEAARAFRADVLDRVGGYDETRFAFEDFELADRVEAHGGRIVRAGRAVWHDEGRVSLVRLLRKKHYYGTQWSGSSEALGSQRMRRRRLPGDVIGQDLVHLPGFVVLKAVDAAGITAGAVHASLRRRRPAVRAA